MGGGVIRPKNVFLGAGQLLQYQQFLCRDGLHLDPPLKKIKVLQQIVFVVV
jgi:hypothetical protein